MRKKQLLQLINEHVKNLPNRQTEDERITLLRDYIENILEEEIRYDDFDYYLHSEFQISLDDFEDEKTEYFFEKFRTMS